MHDGSLSPLAAASPQCLAAEPLEVRIREAFHLEHASDDAVVAALLEKDEELDVARTNRIILEERLRFVTDLTHAIVSCPDSDTARQLTGVLQTFLAR